MMRSLSSAVGGLRAHQTKMDVIGNNIANVNTYGFKASRTTFSDVYYQSLSGGSSPSNSMGGTNPTQIGYGASVATIDVLNTQSGMASTDRALDVYINGDGMIATKDASGNLMYSRLGVLGFDASGNLVDSNGNFVMGFPMDESGKPVVNADGTADASNLSQIKVRPEMINQMTGISIGSTGEIVGVMPGDTNVSINKGLPKWLKDIVVNPESNIAGNINITMDIVSKPSAELSNDWISSIVPTNNSGIEGEFNFEYNNATKMITATGPNGERFSGEYKKNATVDLKDATGKVMFSVKTEQYVVPTANETIGNANYTATKQLSMSTSDKGGNKIVAGPIEYDGYSTSIKFNEDVTITLDPAKVPTTSVPAVTYNPTNPYDISSTGGWLNTISPSGNAAYTEGDIKIKAVKEFVAKISLGSGYTSSKFLDGDAVKKVVEGYYAANPTAVKDGLKATWAESTVTPGSYIVTLVNKDGDAVATSDEFLPGEDIIVGGTVISKAGGAFVAGENKSGDPIGSVSIVEHIYMYDKNDAQIEEPFTFKEGQNVIRMGDMTLSVNSDKLKAFFESQGNPVASSGNSIPAQSIGSFRIEDVEDWKFNGSVAQAVPSEGEKVTIGIMAIGKVPNMAGMSQEGQSYFVTTGNSGEATFVRPGINGTGTLTAGYLEMSNVDVSKEFTDMITTQRGFQANTRIITVSDEMLQELVNLKR